VADRTALLRIIRRDLGGDMVRHIATCPACAGGGCDDWHYLQRALDTLDRRIARSNPRSIG
jgi:hypothetical protein